MDITLLSKMLKELIADNDEVSLPGLGAFVAEFVPASFSDKGLTINPPYRRLSFVQKESGDSLLSAMYADGNGISLETASLIMKKTVAELNAVLRERKVVVFPSLGRLRSTAEGNLFFVPDEDLDIYPEGAGLGSVSLRTHVETPEEIAGAVGSLARELEAVPDSGAAAGECQTAASGGGESVSPAGTDSPRRARKFRWWIIPLVLVLLSGMALGAFFALCRLDPAFIDSLLYTPEELRIINY